ncbi:O-antigen ligase family protein [Candidatus Saccharibacteria bacterium]|nr:O-antigen ligase family protein [Candidatus Saccharibacteria bacterium]
MNFEFSLSLIWLILFDILVFVMLIHSKKLFFDLRKGWVWLLFPVWLTLTIVWSLNSVRGILTVGILWLIYFAIYGMYRFRELFKGAFLKRFLKWFFVSTVLVCLWCFLQCILDLIGISQDYSLMCDGCTYHMFGFPHPNGFAIEPQFMGNLLIAPTIVAAWLVAKKPTNNNLKREHSRGDNFHNGSVGAHTKLQFCGSLRDRCKNYVGSCSLSSRLLLVCFFVSMTTLFLTFSRGAIYAFVVAMLFMSAFLVVQGIIEWKKILKRVGMVWLLVVLSFLFTLNLQGIFAEVSPTNDTYFSGIAKTINHLSLGIIDFRGGETEVKLEEEHVEKPVENFEEKTGKEEAVFNGYVAESTDTRVRLTGAAVEVWSKDLKTGLFGVGLGGAGWALYNNGLSPAPKEIVQNEYASLLLETGIVGVSLFLLTLGLAIRLVLKNKDGLVLTLLVAYGVTLCFFSGLPNALQIYLMTGVIYFLFGNLKNHKKGRSSSARKGVS